MVMSLCYVLINILNAYNVMNEAERCPSKPIFEIILAYAKGR